MSLDVYLKVEGYQHTSSGSGIFVRENGSTFEISRAEWEQRFPGREPVCIDTRADEYVYEANITHNLNKMADAAGIYQHLWCPDELGITLAEQLIEPLREGLAKLTSNPALYKAHNPANGWGDYEGLLGFVTRYLEACIRYPYATVCVSR